MLKRTSASSLVFFAVIYLVSSGWATAQVVGERPGRPDRIPVDSWGAREAAHLLRRAGFGGTPAEVEALVFLGRHRAVNALLNYDDTSGDLETRLASLQLDLTQRTGIQRWWVARMLLTPRPLEEKMTLFWHNHFATSINKVGDAGFMLQQNQMLRRLALGNFRALLLEVARDPAMLIFLDNRLNRRMAPNENFARELMEMFTIGIGNYTEQDVKEVARAFTGWTIRNGSFYFNPSQHDPGRKTILGSTGNFDGTDVIDILAAHPATARRLARHLWEFFAYPDPEEEVVERLADTYLSSGGDIRALVHAIFESAEFYSPRAFRRLVKSPVEIVIGTIRSGLGSADLAALPGYLRRMGQDLFNPPDVGGWEGGLEWIGTSTMLERLNFLNRATSSRNAALAATALQQTLEAARARDAAAVVAYWLERMLGGDSPNELRRLLVEYLGGEAFRLNRDSVDMKVRGLIYLIAASPDYQMN